MGVDDTQRTLGGLGHADASWLTVDVDSPADAAGGPSPAHPVQGRVERVPGPDLPTRTVVSVNADL